MAKRKPQLDASILSAVPILSGEPVLMSLDHARALLARIIQPLSRKPSASLGDSEQSALSVQGNGTAVIPIVGTISKYENWFDDLIGLCSAQKIERLIAIAEGDPNVSQVVFAMDTPGGFVNGSVSLADRVKAMTKPTTAYVHGLCCSAGYYLASQCNSIVARREAWVGNIGVYSVLADLSKFYEQMGIDLSLVTSGPVKGLGADGRVTDTLKAEMQRLVDGLYQQFVTAVIDGRQMSAEQVIALADGRTFLGPEAKENGLIDDVVSNVDDAISFVNNAADAADGSSMKGNATPTQAAATPPTTPAPQASDDKDKDKKKDAGKKDDNKKDDGNAAPSNEDVRAKLNDAKSSAESHTAKARAAMDHYKAMTDEKDGDTVETCKATAAALKACAEESNRVASALEGSEDDAGDGEGGQSKALNLDAALQIAGKPVTFSANDYLQAFGDAGATWFLQGKSFAQASADFIAKIKADHKTEVDALKAENEKLSAKLKSIDPGNPAASFSVAENKGDKESGEKLTGRQLYASKVKMPAAKK